MYKGLPGLRDVVEVLKCLKEIKVASFEANGNVIKVYDALFALHKGFGRQYIFAYVDENGDVANSHTILAGTINSGTMQAVVKKIFMLRHEKSIVEKLGEMGLTYGNYSVHVFPKGNEADAYAIIYGRGGSKLRCRFIWNSNGIHLQEISIVASASNDEAIEAIVGAWETTKALLEVQERGDENGVF